MILSLLVLFAAATGNLLLARANVVGARIDDYAMVKDDVDLLPHGVDEVGGNSTESIEVPTQEEEEEEEEDNRIIGGFTAGRAQYPFMVRLSVGCGGTVVSSSKHIEISF